MDVDRFLKQLMWYILGVLVCFLIALMMGSCTTTKYVSVPEYHYRDSIRTLQVHDSIYEHDSIYQFVKADTCFISRWHTKYRQFIKTDTLLVNKVDSVHVPYPVKDTKTVTIYKLHWWQKDFMWVGIIAIISICGYGVYKNRKLLVKVLRL